MLALVSLLGCQVHSEYDLPYPEVMVVLEVDSDLSIKQRLYYSFENLDKDNGIALYGIARRINYGWNGVLMKLIADVGTPVTIIADTTQNFSTLKRAAGVTKSTKVPSIQCASADPDFVSFANWDESVSEIKRLYDIVDYLNNNNSVDKIVKATKVYNYCHYTLGEGSKLYFEKPKDGSVIEIHNKESILSGLAKVCNETGFILKENGEYADILTMTGSWRMHIGNRPTMLQRDPDIKSVPDYVESYSPIDAMAYILDAENAFMVNSISELDKMIGVENYECAPVV